MTKEQLAAIERLKQDVIGIRAPRSRAEPLAVRPLRWEGAANPNGWRLMADMADDLELVFGTTE